MQRFGERYVSKREFWFGPPLVIESKPIKIISTKVSSPIISHKFCTNCGIKLDEVSFKFCPNCGYQLIK
ncbi:MAG: zinc-ribbon domain-containing protein [Candidatus Hermodarchaeota archaeon]